MVAIIQDYVIFAGAATSYSESSVISYSMRPILLKKVSFNFLLSNGAVYIPIDFADGQINFTYPNDVIQTLERSVLGPNTTWFATARVFGNPAQKKMEIVFDKGLKVSALPGGITIGYAVQASIPAGGNLAVNVVVEFDYL